MFSHIVTQRLWTILTVIVSRETNSHVTVSGEVSSLATFVEPPATDIKVKWKCFLRITQESNQSWGGIMHARTNKWCVGHRILSLKLPFNMKEHYVFPL